MTRPKPSLITLLALTSTFILAACSSEEAESVKVTPQPVKVVSVSTNLAEPVREFPGRVAASETANVASKVAGQIVVVHHQAGDDISAGDLLLELDPTDYQLNLDQAQANYNLAKVSFDRVASSREKNIATQADFDNAKANFEQAEVGLKQATNQLADTKIRAPFDGVVVRVTPKQYDFVGAAQPLVYVQSIKNIDVKFQVPSDIVSRLNEDDAESKAVVEFDALAGEFFEADVREFSSDSDRSTRSFDVTLTLKKPPLDNGNLLPGMDATVYLDLANLEQGEILSVPSSSVFRKNGKTFVWLVTDNRVTETQVSLGELRQDQVTITDGLTATDRVVAAGVNKLANDQTITVWSGE